MAGLAVLGACSDGPVTSEVAGPEISAPRFGVVGSNAHKVTICVDPLSSPGTYNFAVAVSAVSNPLELPTSSDPDLTPPLISQNSLGPFNPGDAIVAAPSLTPGNCSDVFVRNDTPLHVNNRMWEFPVVGIVNPYGQVDITATVPLGYTLGVTCTNDDPNLPQTCANPGTSSANVFHGSSLTYLFTAPAQVDGCTLTVGWWKNQGAASAAQYDFDGGTNNGLAVLNTKPKGNPYYILAHQYIAADLNVANGATLSGAALTAFNDATAYFAVASAGNPLPAPYTHAGVTALADVLDDFNNGDIGPGHCDDD